MKKKGRRRMEGAGHRTSFLKTVVRTLDVLEFLSSTRSVGITELADIMNVGTSTAHRILITLKEKGFAGQDAETRRYVVGHMVFQLARSVIHTIDPEKRIRPHLRELRDRTGENAAFGVITPAGDGTLILAEELADKPVIAKSVLFQRLPILACPCGKAYLLTLDDKKLKEMLSKKDMLQTTGRTTASFASIKRQLIKSRKQGYTLSINELSYGLSAMASGIYNAENKFAGAVMLVGPSFRFTESAVKERGKLLLKTTAKLSMEFESNGIG